MHEGNVKVALDPAEPATVVIVVCGKVIGAALGELRREIDRARKNRQALTIDLSEVTLLDRHGLAFLVEQSDIGARLINCPVYIQPWFARERNSRGRRFHNAESSL